MLGKLNPTTNPYKPEKMNGIFSLGILLLIVPIFVRVLVVLPPMKQMDSIPRLILSLLLTIGLSLAVFLTARSKLA